MAARARHRPTDSRAQCHAAAGAACSSRRDRRRGSSVGCSSSPTRGAAIFSSWPARRPRCGSRGARAAGGGAARRHRHRGSRAAGNPAARPAPIPRLAHRGCLLSIAGIGAFPHQSAPRTRPRRRCRAHAAREVPRLAYTGPAAAGGTARAAAAWAGADRRADRLRQEHDAGRAGRGDQPPRAAGTSSPSKTRSSTSTRTPAA